MSDAARAGWARRLGREWPRIGPHDRQGLVTGRRPAVEQGVVLVTQSVAWSLSAAGGRARRGKRVPSGDGSVDIFERDQFRHVGIDGGLAPIQRSPTRLWPSATRSDLPTSTSIGRTARASWAMRSCCQRVFQFRHGTAGRRKSPPLRPRRPPCPRWGRRRSSAASLDRSRRTASERTSYRNGRCWLPIRRTRRTRAQPSFQVDDTVARLPTRSRSGRARSG